MEITNTILACDNCKKPYAYDKNLSVIKLPSGDLDSCGIWFGNIGEHLWFADETFC
jgi:hypothetical protein